MAFAYACPESVFAQSHSSPGFRLVDVTRQAGIHFQHNSGAYGAKFLPETLGPGCAFLDYDQDGWQDILLINGMDWPGHKRQRSTMRLYRNNRNGTFTDVTRHAGLDIEMYGMGVAVGDYNNDGFPDLFVTCVGQNRLFRNTGKGTFVDVTKAEPTTVYDRDGMRVTAMGIPHGNLPTLAYRVETQGVTVVFSSDQNGTNLRFPGFAKGADILLMHLAIGVGANNPNQALPAVVGSVAQSANPKRLILSHIANFDLDAALGEVKKNYSGPLTIGADLQCTQAK